MKYVYLEATDENLSFCMDHFTDQYPQLTHVDIPTHIRIDLSRGLMTTLKTHRMYGRITIVELHILKEIMLLPTDEAIETYLDDHGGNGVSDIYVEQHKESKLFTKARF